MPTDQELNPDTPAPEAEANVEPSPEVVEKPKDQSLKRVIRRSSRKIYRWIRHPRHRKRSKFRNWLAERVFDRKMWTHPTAHSFGGGMGAGLAVGMIIVPFQMFFVAILCCFFRFHVPVALIAVWTSNPVTWVPYLWFEDKVGEWMYRVAGFDLEKFASAEIELLGLEFNPIFVYSGGLLCTIPAAILGYIVGFYVGLRLVRRREKKKEIRLEEARARAAQRAREADGFQSSTD